MAYRVCCRCCSGEGMVDDEATGLRWGIVPSAEAAKTLLSKEFPCVIGGTTTKGKKVCFARVQSGDETAVGFLAVDGSCFLWSSKQGPFTQFPCQVLLAPPTSHQWVWTPDDAGAIPLVSSGGRIIASQTLSLGNNFAGISRDGHVEFTDNGKPIKSWKKASYLMMKPKQSKTALDKPALLTAQPKSTK